MFETIPERPSAVDVCEAELRKVILAGEVAPGDRLPPERALAEQFGVNRVTVRSALDRLSGAGLVRVRQGSGYVVRDYRDGGGPDLIGEIAELARGSADLIAVAADLLLVRRQLAGAVLERLVAGTTAAARARIGDAVDRLSDVAAGQGSSAEIAEADLAVVSAIVDATGSPVLRLCMNPIAAVLAELPELRDAIYENAAESVTGFTALRVWLEEPDPDAIDRMLADFARRDALTLERLRDRKGTTS